MKETSDIVSLDSTVSPSKAAKIKDPIFKRRWPIIFTFFILSANNSFQMVEFLPISQQVSEYYQVR